MEPLIIGHPIVPNRKNRRKQEKTVGKCGGYKMN
jgi:hypothetical protein